MAVKHLAASLSGCLNLFFSYSDGMLGYVQYILWVYCAIQETRRLMIQQILQGDSASTCAQRDQFSWSFWFLKQVSLGCTLLHVPRLSKTSTHFTLHHLWSKLLYLSTTTATAPFMLLCIQHILCYPSIMPPLPLPVFGSPEIFILTQWPIQKQMKREGTCICLLSANSIQKQSHLSRKWGAVNSLNINKHCCFPLSNS